MKKNKRFRAGLKLGLTPEDIDTIEIITAYNEIDFKELSCSLLKDEHSIIKEIVNIEND